MGDIKDCPDCGGTHYGSSRCPLKYPPKPSASMQLLRANQRLTAAARRMKEANEELDGAEREHRIAVELVESLERIDSKSSTAAEPPA